ncbi:uncharacterized protein LOC106711682 [Papilio machaon]|uniref:uncharacterized protein LOC106711682 n=1 Tax=Papilio machaon TaxID=76193 RepID=UPI001E664C26|nr:uncharacterized protein LOC106711682 [Papilio machaon]
MITAEELEKAELLWMNASQREAFPEEIDMIGKGRNISKNNRFVNIRVLMDDKGTLHVRARTSQNVDPPILDGKHPYTRLYIAHVHEQLHHGGVEMVVNELRQRLFILKIRPSVKTVIKSCMQCRIRKAKPASPYTGDLPAARVAHHARPFTFTGLDYFGPIEVTVARHREKRYGALFTCLMCLTSRAIHIEVVSSLSADAAISALRRFLARRGFPKEIWSDNATCFKAANKELAEAAQEALENEVNCRRITWKYIPPSAHGDEAAITPNHILIGPNCHAPVPGHFTSSDVSARQLWRRAQALADDFWRRWVRECLPLLRHRREPYGSGGVAPQLGDVVIICDSNLPRNTWPRGRVTRLYPGADGEVRVVDVTTSNGHVLRRPTKKLVVLPTGSRFGDGGRMCTTA